MRTRRRASVSVTVPLGQAHYWGSLPSTWHTYYSGWWPDPTYYPYQEDMCDLGGPKHSGSTCGRLAYKPCNHRKIAVKSFTPLSTQYVQSKQGSTPVCWAERYNNFAAVIDASTPPGLRDYTTDPGLFAHSLAIGHGLNHDSSFYADSWEKRKPTMRSRANLAVFLYELRDIKRMFDLLPKEHFGLNSWRSVLKYGNSQHLNYNFGWKPFVKDLKATFDGLKSFDSRLSRFVSNAGRDLSTGDSTGSEGSDEWYIRPTQWTCYEDVKVTLSWSLTQTSSFQFRYSIPDYSQEELRRRAIADTLGLHLTPANIWAVIPWSFVVDWFQDVGSYLRQYSTDWTNPYIDFIQGCQSLKAAYTLEIFSRYSNHYDPNFSESTNPFQKVMTVFGKQFSRTIGVPHYVVSDETLNTDRIRLLSSLLAARVL